jgi:hypothetical protein
MGGVMPRDQSLRRQEAQRLVGGPQTNPLSGGFFASPYTQQDYASMYHNIMAPQGPQMGADRRAEALYAQGYSSAQVDQIQRLEYENLMKYGSRNPGVGSRMFHKAREVDQLHGGRGIVPGGVTALELAGTGAAGSVLKPIVQGSAVGQFASNVGARARAVPGVRQAEFALNRVASPYYGAQTSGGKMLEKGLNKAATGLLQETYGGTPHSGTQRAISDASKLGVAPRAAKGVLPFLHLLGTS